LTNHPRISPFGLLFVLALGPFPALAGEHQPAIAEASAAFQRAVAGDAAAAARAEALFQKLSAEEPGDPVLLAYAGASATMVGRDASSPLDAVKIAEGGLDQIDQALRLLGPQHDRPAPGQLPPRLETLLVAASSYLQVPDEIFHRQDDGKAALQTALSHPLYARLPPAVQARFTWLSAVLARGEKRPDDERAALRQALALDPQGPLTARIQDRLSRVAP
jgi:hypothetical protein